MITDTLAASEAPDFQSELLTRALLPVTDEDVIPPLKSGAQPLSNAERALDAHGETKVSEPFRLSRE